MCNCNEFTTGDRIRKARTSAGLTQHQLAKQIHASQQVISRIENGQVDPKFDTVRAIAHTTNRPINFFG